MPTSSQATCSPKLFQQINVGRMTLHHRVVLAPLTRFRIDAEHIPLLPIVSEYYAQRGSSPGTLLIAEAMLVAPQAGGHNRFPGIWSDAQIAAWKKITEAVHARGSYIYLQVWGLGRTADPGVLNGGGLDSASDIPPGYQYTPPTPRALTIAKIKENVRLFAKAASNAVHLAGFDGVEIYSANGVLLDRFLQDVTNERTDEYGGGLANRARLGLEILGAVAREIGADRMGIRISPWGKYQGMGMADPKPTYTYFVSQMKERWPNMAYLHVTEPRVDSGAELGPDGVDGKERDDESIPAEEENDFLRRIWSPRPFITAGGYTRELAMKAAERGDIVAVGRHFLANPDLPLRWKDDLPSNDETTPPPWPITTLTSPGKEAEAPSDPPVLDGTFVGVQRLSYHCTSVNTAGAPPIILSKTGWFISLTPPHQKIPVVTSLSMKINRVWGTFNVVRIYLPFVFSL